MRGKFWLAERIVGDRSYSRLSRGGWGGGTWGIFPSGKPTLPTQFSGITAAVSCTAKLSRLVYKMQMASLACAWYWEGWLFGDFRLNKPAGRDERLAGKKLGHAQIWPNQSHYLFNLSKRKPHTKFIDIILHIYIKNNVMNFFLPSSLLQLMYRNEPSLAMTTWAKSCIRNL